MPTEPGPAKEATDSSAIVSPASFRDPAGFVFWRDGVLHRQVHEIYRVHYERLMGSGLYDALVARGSLVPHEEVERAGGAGGPVFKILRPLPVDFVSYPYEWAFGELQDAALLTLDVHRLALDHGLSLKDASAYNVQFHRGRPILIDTLSFETYREGRPWVAYRQFCQHFLAPLALMAHRDVRLAHLLRAYVDGLPLDLASRLLPAATRWRPGLAMHLHLHARAQHAYSSTRSARPKREVRVSRLGMVGLVESLRRTVAGLDWEPAGTEWATYYRSTNYSDAAFEHKKRLVGEYLDAVAPRRVWDLGANTGVFSRIASGRGASTVAFDIDPAAVESNYRQAKTEPAAPLLPLVLDLTNPSPGLGWAGVERDSLAARGPVDCALALALVHHLAISANVPLARIAEFLSRLCAHLVIEFVPKEDSQVQRLLGAREDIFADYDRAHFEAAFSARFRILRAEDVSGTQRRLYLMQRI
ncbi:MAG: SAM-dependent methyltransferase [Thermoanaerobaculia bacterium]